MDRASGDAWSSPTNQKLSRLRKKTGRSGGRCGLELVLQQPGRIGQLPSSLPGEDGVDELSPECPHDGAGLGVAQLGAGAGVGAGSAAGTMGFGAEGFGAEGFGEEGFDVEGFDVEGLAAAVFFAGLFLALAFLADFFGAVAFDFLADFLPDFLAAFFAFFADFFADFFFAAIRRFLAFLAFLPAFFLPLAIVILLLPPTNVYRAFQVVRFKLQAQRQAQRSVQSWPGTACRPIEKLNRVHHRN